MPLRCKVWRANSRGGDALWGTFGSLGSTVSASKVRPARPKGHSGPHGSTQVDLVRAIGVPGESEGSVWLGPHRVLEQWRQFSSRWFLACVGEALLCCCRAGLHHVRPPP